MTQNILVVDDDLYVLSILAFVFESREYSCEHPPGQSGPPSPRV